jgi:hypothetical protein
MKLKLALLCALGLASANALACYTVYDRSNRVMYQGAEPPVGVDMSQPLHRALERRYPGAHMVFNAGDACMPVPFAQLARPQGPAAPANTLVIASRAAPELSDAPFDTRVMGAGPAQGARRVVATPVAARSSSPLLTDRRTALAMNLPHKVMSGDIVLVPAQAAARVNLPNMTVIPAAATAPAGVGAQLQTSAMGAGPAPGETVITEMRNPPVTVVQRGGTTTITRN